MFYTTQYLLKKRKTPPLGLSVRRFMKKLNTPRASKPWRDRSVLVSGSVEMDANTGVCDVQSEQSQSYYGNLAISAPMGLRGISPEHTLQVHQNLLPQKNRTFMHVESAVKEHVVNTYNNNLSTSQFCSTNNNHINKISNVLQQKFKDNETNKSFSSLSSSLSFALEENAVLEEMLPRREINVSASQHREQTNNKQERFSHFIHDNNDNVIGKRIYESVTSNIDNDSSNNEEKFSHIVNQGNLNVNVLNVVKHGSNHNNINHVNNNNNNNNNNNISINSIATNSGEDTQTDALATIPVSEALQMNVQKVTTYGDGPVPIHFAHLKRTKREAAESIVLPRHLNQLFHQIMGWSAELGEMEQHTSDVDHDRNVKTESDVDEQPLQQQLSPSRVRAKMSTMTDALKYGVLMDSYEKDKFALEHRLSIAGNKFERKFLEWEGMHILDQSASAELDNVFTQKTAIVMDTPTCNKIPVINRDCCPGCGAVFQDKSSEEFGYVSSVDLARYLQARERRRQARNEYASRMSELMSHWSKHGRQVGEEWLDFMTQEEFNAFYRDRDLPFVCNRCNALENMNVHGRRKVWSAPDFTSQLQVLRERKCVVVLVVDLTDFPGSMVYDLPGLISMNNDVIIAINKTDCVNNRSFNYDRSKNSVLGARLINENYIAKWVQNIATSFGLPAHQIKAVVPLSAKRGWNVNKLISAIEETANLNLRRPEPPLSTYFVGVANVGKSSLINAIAHYLYTPQPPHPASTKIYYTLTDKNGHESIYYRWYTPPNYHDAEMRDVKSHHDKRASKLLTVSSLPGTTVGVSAVRIALHPEESNTTGTDNPIANRSNNNSSSGSASSFTKTSTRKQYSNIFLYDTPGLIPHWHRCSPLTLYEMRRTLIRRFRNPECYILIPGHTLFVSGLAAIDVVKGPSSGLLFMVYTSHKVRNAIVDTEQSETFWAEQLGKAIDPPSSIEQLTGCNAGATHTITSNHKVSHSIQTSNTSANEGEPAHVMCGLSESKSYYFECYNKHCRRPKADIYICGIGWVSFCVSVASDVVLRVRTLPGMVHGVREPLRFKDLMVFKRWPKLRRNNTSQSIIDLKNDVDDDSVSTVVRLVAKPTASSLSTSTSATSSPESTTVTSEATNTAENTVAILKSLEKVPKAFHPHDTFASSTPLHELMEELCAGGKL